ncbi:hypothetical protein BHE74_00031056 [Ensete ventricosum]|nr:hypothetical protein GW17_00020084 [Ensete ventricosum]RWW61865.1 hypothetical protein BHE74_00031056 [Ensete ventricosum]
MEGGARERLLGEEAEVEEGLGRRLWKENKKLWVVAGPSIFTRFSTFGVTVISQAFVGHIGSTELAAYAVVSTVLMRFANGILVRTHASHPPFSPPPPLPSPLPFLRIPQQDICTLHFFIRGSSTDPLRFFHPSSSSSYVGLMIFLLTSLGMASALETLCGQSYGAKQYHMLGIYLQRSWIILCACALLLTPIFIFTTPLLKLLGQEESIAEMAGTVAHWFIPVFFSFVWAFTIQMYLQSQSKNIIITYLAVATLTLHLFLSWFMVMKLNLGLAGVMGSMILAMWIPVMGQLAFVCFGGCPETWTGFSFTAFLDLWAIVKLSLSSGVMLW